MISDDYFDASLLMGDSNIKHMKQEKFSALTFETKVGLLISKITNEALIDNKINYLKLEDENKISKIAFFHHLTSVLISGYLKREGKNINNNWSFKSFFGFFSLNTKFNKDYWIDQYQSTNKIVLQLIKDGKTDKRAEEIVDTYSTLIIGFVQNKGLNMSKSINFREIFKNQMMACFDLLN